MKEMNIVKIKRIVTPMSDTLNNIDFFLCQLFFLSKQRYIK
jgi:hypothetical protein